MSKFEKISFKQFSNDIKEDIDLYNEYNIPRRATIGSAGYDIYLIEDITIESGKTVKIPTGTKCKLDNGLVLLIIIRSSMGIKKHLTIVNQIGVIDEDYYNNIGNEGHMFIFIKNNGSESLSLKKGTAVAQGIITKYYTVDEEEVTDKRISGIGTTDKES